MGCKWSGVDEVVIFETQKNNARMQGWRANIINAPSLNPDAFPVNDMGQWPNTEAGDD